MTDIYDQHAAAFKHTAAYVITKNGERVATIAFKFPKDGAGRLYCYLHVIGIRMVRGSATGGNYDKQSAAAHAAAQAIKIDTPEKTIEADAIAIKAAIKDEGAHWDQDLRKAGFTVLQAV